MQSNNTQSTNAIEIGTAEIAQILGLSRPHVTGRLVKRMDFPPPSTDISQRVRYWRRADVMAFKSGQRWKRHAK